jgi:hypothetical protein
MWNSLKNSRRRAARHRTLVAIAAAALSISLFQPPAAAENSDGGKGGSVEKSPTPAAAKVESTSYQLPEYDPAPHTLSEEPPETPAPERYEDFKPGLRLLLEDLRSSRLEEEAFVNHAYAKLGYLSGVPERYRDAALPQEQRVILGMALGRELARLPHPVRQSIQNQIAHADMLAPLIARDGTQPSAHATTLAPASECGQQGNLPGEFECLHQTADFSVFYNIGGENNVDPYDGPGSTDRGDVQNNGVPNYVDRMSRSLETAWATYASLGYKPRQDADKKVAVFLGSPDMEPNAGFAQPYELADANIIHIGTKFSSGQEADEFYLPRHELFHSMQYRYIG